MKPVLLLDDECIFCNKTANFIIRNGGEGKFDFISLYSGEGKEKLRNYGLPGNYDESVVLIKEEEVYLKSEAVVEIAEELKGWVKILTWTKILPVGFRNRIYDLIAKHRHKLG